MTRLTSAIERAAEVDSISTLTLAVVGVVVLGVAAWLLSVASSVVRYHAFELSRADEVLHARFGLTTTRRQTLPVPRVQQLLIVQNPLRWVLGLAVVRVRNIGSATGATDNLSDVDVLAPLTTPADGDAIVAQLLPESRPGGPYRRVSPITAVRFARTWAIVVALSALAYGWWSGNWSGLIGVPLGVPVAWQRWRRAGYRLDAGHLWVRSGILGMTRSVIPARKIQSVALRQTIFDRRRDVADVHVEAGGPARVTVPHLRLADARELRDALAALAARSTAPY